MTPAVYDELRRLARYYLSAERRDHTLQPTALVHEAYLKLLGQEAPDWRNRAQFVGLAATMMRRILLNHAEARAAQKRQPDAQYLEIDRSLDLFDRVRLNLFDLDAALTRLSAMDPRQAQIVELRFFGGLSIEETAEALDISSATVKREWSVARLFLLKELA